jgi:hypothetical protein
MKRIVALALLLLVGFYIAWPAWSGYQLGSALATKNAGLLQSKIDFDRVRSSMRPTVTSKIEGEVEKFSAQAGPAGAMILGQIKGDLIPKIIETTLATVVTPETVIRIVSEGGSVKESIERIMREQMSKSGGLPGLGGGGAAGGGGGSSGGLGGLAGALGGIGGAGGGALGDLLGKAGKGRNPVRDVSDEPAKTEAPAAEAKGSPKFSLANIKTFRLNGPLSYRVGVSKDAKATEADLTAEMSFTGGDWKITGLVPRL